MPLALADHPELPARVPPAPLSLLYHLPLSYSLTSPQLMPMIPQLWQSRGRHPTHRLVHTYTVTTEHKLPAHWCTGIPSVTCAGHTHCEVSQDLTQLCWVAIQRAWHVFLFWEEEMRVTVTDCSADPGLASPCSVHEPPLPRQPRAVAPGRKVGQDMGTAEGPPGGCQGLAPRLIWSGSTAKLSPGTAPHRGPVGLKDISEGMALCQPQPGTGRPPCTQEWGWIFTGSLQKHRSREKPRVGCVWKMKIKAHRTQKHFNTPGNMDHVYTGVPSLKLI